MIDVFIGVDVPFQTIRAQLLFVCALWGEILQDRNLSITRDRFDLNADYD